MHRFIVSIQYSLFIRYACFIAEMYLRLLQETAILEGGVRGGGEVELPTATLTPPERFCITLGSDETHFNASLIVRGRVTIQCP